MNEVPAVSGERDTPVVVPLGRRDQAPFAPKLIEFVPRTQAANFRQVLQVTQFLHFEPSLDVLS
jgi:hypothetical protein